MTNILIKIAAVVALLVVLFVGEQYIERRGYDRAMSEAQAQIEGSKRAAADRLALEIHKTRRAEEALQTAKNTQELKDANHHKTVESLSDRLRALAHSSGRLRDPYSVQAAGCGAGGGGSQGQPPTAPGDRSSDPTEAGGLLSAELGGLLQRLTREADDINVAYASCRADAYAVRGNP
jgi:hypothetical protein